MNKELNSAQFGKISYSEEEIIRFPNGLPGFESIKEYILIKHEDNSPFLWLQSINVPEIALLVAEPWEFVKDYEFNLSDQEREELKISDKVDSIMVLNVLVITTDYTKMTINLRAPIIINTHCNLGKQIVLEQDHYSIRHFIFQSKTPKTEDK